MTLNVQLRILVPEHHHRGIPCTEGDIIDTDPNRARRLIAQGIAEKCGVVEVEAALPEDAAESEG